MIHDGTWHRGERRGGRGVTKSENENSENANLGVN
jgi:hypothetical protein